MDSGFWFRFIGGFICIFQLAGRPSMNRLIGSGL